MSGKATELWVYLDELKAGDFVLSVIGAQIKVLRMVQS